MVSYYSRTPETPDGFNLDKPFDLPADDPRGRDAARRGDDRPVATRCPTSLSTTPLQFVRGVGPRRAADLERVGLLTVEDLLLRFPLRYENRAELLPISALRPGQIGDGRRRGAVDAACGPTRRPGFRLFELIVARRDRAGPRRVSESGVPARRVSSAASRSCCSARSSSAARADCSSRIPSTKSSAARRDDDDETVHTGRIVPIYEKAGSMTPRMQRTLVHRLLAELPAEVADPMPAPIRAARGAAGSPRRRSLETHFPPPGTDVDALNAFRDAGAAAADLRGVLPLSGRARAAQAAPRGRAQAARRGRRRSHPRVGAARAAVQADRRPEDGAARDRRPTCSGPSR